jgi:hypothetical protein
LCEGHATTALQGRQSCRLCGRANTSESIFTSVVRICFASLDGFKCKFVL